MKALRVFQLAADVTNATLDAQGYPLVGANALQLTCNGATGNNIPFTIPSIDLTNTVVMFPVRVQNYAPDRQALPRARQRHRVHELSSARERHVGAAQWVNAGGIAAPGWRWVGWHINDASVIGTGATLASITNAGSCCATTTRCRRHGWA